MRSKLFKKGEFIMRFGQVADFLLVIYEGSCSVKIRNLTIMQRKAPDLIGENALFSNQ